MGVLIYEMRSGRSPFESRTQLDMFKRISKRELVFPRAFTTEEQDLIGTPPTCTGHRCSAVLHVHVRTESQSEDSRCIYLPCSEAHSRRMPNRNTVSVGMGA